MSTGLKTVELLLAEDNPADADLVRLALRHNDVSCTLHVVSDGATAIDLLETLDNDSNAPPLDLCILDMHLPKHSGEEILKRLRSTEKYALTPVIVMSGVNSPDIEEAATRHAAMVFFRKPSSVDEYMRLGNIVDDVLRKTRGATT